MSDDDINRTLDSPTHFREVVRMAGWHGYFRAGLTGYAKKDSPIDKRPKPAGPEPNKIAGSQAPLGNSQAGSSSFPFVFVARARTYRAGREAELLVLGFPSGAWETAKSLHDLSKVNCLEANGCRLP
jgi:hypothetical protein